MAKNQDLTRPSAGGAERGFDDTTEARKAGESPTSCSPSRLLMVSGGTYGGIGTKPMVLDIDFPA